MVESNVLRGFDMLMFVHLFLFSCSSSLSLNEFESHWHGRNLVQVPFLFAMIENEFFWCLPYTKGDEMAVNVPSV